MTEDIKGWIASVLSAITSAFNKFVGVFKKHGLVYTTLTLVLFVTAWTLIINPIRIDSILEQRLQHQWEREQQQIEQRKEESENKRFEANDILSPLMENIVDRYHISNVLLLELHNSTESMNGVGFNYFSCTYENINYDDTNVDYVGDHFVKQTVVNLFDREMINKLIHNDYLYFTNLSGHTHRHKRFFYKVERLGFDDVMLIGIKDSKGRLAVVLCLLNDTPFDADNIYNNIKPLITEINNTLVN